MAQKTLRDFLQETEDAIHLDRIDDALAHCLHILAYFPESLETQRLLGEIYLAQGRLDEAQQAFDWVLTNDPEHVIAYCNRALVSERLSDFDAALDCYQQAYELSRGNGQIRQQFNQLSSRAGQPGFMLSRAGLARLYMRGDLLTQSIQEWESVLAVTPDRLDVRVGLLETYWRAGLYEQVVSLATQILQDVPGCLKALLLLSYVTAPKSMQQAQDLVRRAEIVDPDLIMAQDLFSDILASQPDDPFLRLLQKQPASLTSSVGVLSPSTLRASNEVNTSVFARESSGPSVSSDDFAHWRSGPDGESNAAQFSSPPTSLSPSLWAGDKITAGDVRDISQGVTLLPEVPDLVTQLRNDITLDAPWRIPDQATQISQQNNSDLEPWQLLQEALHDMNPNADMPSGQSPYEEDALWEILDTFNAQQQNTVSNSGSVEDVTQEEVGVPWSSSTKEAKSSAPPAWLSMLTQTDKRQPDSSPLEEEAFSPGSKPVTDAVPSISPVWEASRQELPLHEEAVVSQTSAAVQQDEDSFFGPEWLKSIGATALEIEASGRAAEQDIPVFQDPLASQSQEPEPQVAYEPWTFSQNSHVDLQASQDAWTPQMSPYESGQEQESWMDQLSRSESHPTYDSWEAQTIAPAQESELSWMEQMAERQPENVPASEAERAEQDLVTTLEELEKDLRSKGFIPMEPKTLSAIAQIQESAIADPSSVPVSKIQEEQESYQTPSLSSAFAELGHFAAPSQSQDTHAMYSSAQPEPFMLDTPAEPAWIAALRSTTSSSAEVPEQASSSQEEIIARNSAVAGPARQKTHELPSVPPTHTDPAIAAVPPSSPLLDEPFETIKVAAIGRKALLDGGLETTMKRPAVRLQPMQQRPYTAVGREQPAPPKGRYIERAVNKASDSNMGNRERLLKGYQCQLIGEYDEAMQDYRIVIRSAPELLGDVVSNVRALLKLAPKYSVGYRVLGDAYMRQGEYLQAMEAYNKALTMAKKTKS